MRLSLPLISLVFALSACGAPERQPEPPATPEAAAARSIAPPQTPPGEATPRYGGLWAVSQEMCEDPAWRFQAREVGTQGEVHCEFTEVAVRDARYVIKAMCTAEAPPAPYDIELAVGEGEPRVMLVSGGPWMAGTQLVHCGPLPDR